MSSRGNHDTAGKATKAGGEGDATAPAAGAGRAARVRSRDLLRDGEQLIIEHGGREYCLRVTSNGKLILTA